jgi:hypothetical protein
MSTKSDESGKAETTYVFDEHTDYPLIAAETVWQDEDRLDVRTHRTDKESGERRHTQKGVSLGPEKAAWLLPILARFVASNWDVSDACLDAIVETFSTLQSYLLDDLPPRG